MPVTPEGDGDPSERRYPTSPRLSDGVEERLRAVLCPLPRRVTPADDDGATVVYPPPDDDEPVEVVVSVAPAAAFDTVRDRVGTLGEPGRAFPDQRLFTAAVPANRFDDLLAVPGVEAVGLNRAVSHDGGVNRSSGSRTLSSGRRPR